MNIHLDKISTLTYKIELIRGRNVSLILISFNILILIILMAQEFLYISDHNDIEATIMTIIVTSCSLLQSMINLKQIICFCVLECFGLHTIIYFKQNRMRVYHLMYYLIFFFKLSYDSFPKSLIILQIMVLIGEFVEINDENIRFHILEISIRFVLIFLLMIMNILKYVSIQYMSQNLELSKANSMIRLGKLKKVISIVINFKRDAK